ncbi:MAG: MMPL family transporter [Solirubrobacterales bacterium]
MLRKVSSFSAGPRSKWVVFAVWLLLGVALGPLQPKLQDATKNENSDFLPNSAEATKVEDLLTNDFPGGREVSAIVVYTDPGGLEAADRARIRRDAARLSAPGYLIKAARPIQPFGPPGGPATAPGGAAGGPSLVSRDGTTALMIVPTFTRGGEAIQANVKRIRAVVPSPDSPGLRSYVTGPAGFTADAIETFRSLDTTLLLVTVTLVLVLLLAIYRSPVVALVPLFVVGIAYVIAAAAIYGLVKAGVFDVNGQSTGILIVLMFGAGTDYCLLIVSRFREELRRTDDKHAAMVNATERTAPAILSAGGTVFFSMLVLLLADYRATQSLGPVLAIGIALMLLVGLTLLPALLSILGRRAFWPAIPRTGEGEDSVSGIWRRIGHLVHDRPATAMTVVVLVLALGALGNLESRGTLDFGEGFRTEPDSKAGQALIDSKLSPGQAAASDVIVARAAATPVAAALRRQPAVDSVTAAGVSKNGRLVHLSVTLARDPFSDQANADIPGLRDAVRAAAGGRTALVGGFTATNYDTDRSLQRDARIIVPLILLLILVILIILLRALVAPLYLVATVVLSYAFALGASKLVFTHLFRVSDSDASLATFAFLFLVALGVDYNIFLISRIREESARVGVKEGVIGGLEKTGAVITSAGLILAGTFSALMALPLEALFQLGFTVALGLLVDTFLVRTVLVPSIAFQLGERNWWPSRRPGRGEAGAQQAAG